LDLGSNVPGRDIRRAANSKSFDELIGAQ
jgi:hypothetical protein